MIQFCFLKRLLLFASVSLESSVMGHDELLQVLKEKMRLEGQLESLSSEANQVLFCGHMLMFFYFPCTGQQIQIHQGSAPCFATLTFPNSCPPGIKGEDGAPGPTRNSERSTAGQRGGGPLQPGEAELADRGGWHTATELQPAGEGYGGAPGQPGEQECRPGVSEQ